MFSTSQEILNTLGNKAQEKTSFSFAKLFLLSIAGGAFIALGFLGFIRMSGTMPAEWGSLATFAGSLIFPIGLMSIVFIGGELVTGNMMTMTLGFLQKKITAKDLAWNLIVVLVGNLIGGILIAYFFGHIVGMTEGAFLNKTLAVGTAKINDSFLVALVSGIGCNIFVCMAVWLTCGAKDFFSKILCIWIPISIFVVIGFQHVAANAFIVPAAIFSGETDITWVQFLQNTVAVFFGNLIGGAFCIALPCFVLYSPVEEVAMNVEDA